MKNNNHSITKEYKEEIDDSELDMTLYDEILGKDWSDKEKYHDTIYKGRDNQYGWQGESHPISIDRMMKHLQDLKDKGCNHVEIMYHCDHIGYNIYGLDIHRSTNEEVKAHKKWQAAEKEKEKQKKIKELTKELEKVKKS
jgi:hypothetical protein